MKIVVKANAKQKEEWLLKAVSSTVEMIWNDISTDADAYFDLLFEEEGAAFNHITNKPVFVNAMITTCKELPDNYIRINAWEGFLKRNIVEVVTLSQQKKVDEVMNALGWKYQLAPDEPGMIAARIIAMIINEAYFGLQDGISTKEDIDIAMKLGTNYPFGPFEWSKKIGLHNIYLLLKTLSKTDTRYQPALQLENELKSIV